MADGGINFSGMKVIFITGRGIFQLTLTLFPVPANMLLMYPVFPMLSGKALDGSSVTLPQDTLGFVTLIAIAFPWNVQGMIDSWTGPLFRDFGGDLQMRVYEIPMISPVNWLKAKWIERGMRSGIAVDRHPFVIPYYGDRKPYVLALDIDDPALVHLFLLDRQGNIRWKGSGPLENNTLQGLEDLVRSLFSE
jgi:hypothetical protein